MLAYLRAHCPIPVLTGLPFGHIVDKVTLAVGAEAQLTAHAAGWQLKMSHYTTLDIRGNDFRLA